MNMRDANVALDWYSFTIPVNREISGRENVVHELQKVMRYVLPPMAYNALLVDGEWSELSGRRPYQAGYGKDGVSVYFGGQDTCLVEITGVGCDKLRAVNAEREPALTAIIRATHERATRVDFAIDIETETRPSDFVSAGYNRRIKSHGHVKTASGETNYVGAKKGERYARVYRYDNDHHRSHLLRIETVSRAKYAKMVARYLTYYTVRDVAQMTANYFQFKHEEMPAMSEMREVIKLPKRESSDEKRLQWLKHQVAPAVTDMLVRGVITKEHLMELFAIEHVQERLF